MVELSKTFELTDHLATPEEVVRPCDLSQRLVTLIASAAITLKDHEGRILLMGKSGAAYTFTLPAATGSGAIYRFIVSVVNTSNYIIQVASAADVMQGGVVAYKASVATDWLTASDSDTITLNGTTKGGVSIGDWVELIDILSGKWAVKGAQVGSGTIATPFSAAV